MDPLLIGGKKFDMRIYVLVVSYQPLTVYLYKTGFARFCHSRYSNSPDEITNNCKIFDSTVVHLTNVAIQKTADNYDEKVGGKWDLRSLKMYLMSRYGQEPVGEAFGAI
jgi:tubulin polyglutamylase TTLL9